MNEARASLDRHGWVSVPAPAGVDLRAVADGLHLGGLHRSVIERVSPKPADQARAGTMSARYGMGAFPLHTERAHWPIPPRYVLLRSIGAESDRPTLLWDSRRVTGVAEPSARLQRAAWIVAGRDGPFVTSVFSAAGEPNRSCFRYDALCMTPAGEGAAEVAEILETHLDPDGALPYRWVPGRVLIIDNWRVLHGRGLSSDDDQGRVLERLVVA
jgi:hypothetical protein